MTFDGRYSLTKCHFRVIFVSFSCHFCDITVLNDDILRALFADQVSFSCHFNDIRTLNECPFGVISASFWGHSEGGEKGVVWVDGLEGRRRRLP